MKKITKCRLCQNKKIKTFLDLGKQPYANSLLNSPTQKEKSYPLSLSWCSNCNLVQLNHTADPNELFSKYVWVTATSSTAREHARKFAQSVTSRTSHNNRGYILELASNDGTFLLPFIEKGYKVLGVDPAKNIAKIATSQGIPTLAKFFDIKTAKAIQKKYGNPSVVIARNVVPHVATLHEFIEGASICLDNNGLLIIEAHYAKIINEQLHYDSIYHEHLCYFTIKSMEALLNSHNFSLVDLEESPISGGSLIYYARKQKSKPSLTVEKYKSIEQQSRINTLKSWQNFARRVSTHKKSLLKILNKYSKQPIVGWGASARSSTLLNYTQVGPKHIQSIADLNPLKHGKFTAGTHIPINNPDIVFQSHPSTVFILAWNFTQEIIKSLKEKYAFKGTCIVPLPNNPKLLRLK